MDLDDDDNFWCPVADDDDEQPFSLSVSAPAKRPSRKRVAVQRYNDADFDNDHVDEHLGDDDSFSASISAEENDDDRAFIASPDDEDADVSVYDEEEASVAVAAPAAAAADDEDRYERNIDRSKQRASTRKTHQPSVAVPPPIAHSATLGLPASSDSEVAKRVSSADPRKRAASYFHAPMRAPATRAAAANASDEAPDIAKLATGGSNDGGMLNYDGIVEQPARAKDDDTAQQQQPASKLQLVLATMQRKQEIPSIDFDDAALHFDMNCPLCGFMEADDEKHNVAALASAANEASANALLLSVEQGAGHIEDYRYADIARIVCQHLARANEWNTCALAAAYYHNNVFRKSGGQAPRISTRQIFRHFFGEPGAPACVMDPRFQCIRRLRQCAALADEIEAGMVMQNAATGERYVDVKQAKAFSDICKTMQTLYTWDTKSMRFFAPELPVDTELSNSLILPGQCLKRTARKQRHAGNK